MNNRRSAYIWQDFTTAQLPALADLAKALGLDTIWLKAGDSGAVWPQWNTQNIAPFTAQGITVYPWFWLNYDRAEIGIVADAYRRVPFDAYVLDVEIPDGQVNTHWSDCTNDEAHTFIQDVRKSVPAFCGFSSCGSWDGSQGNWFPYEGVAQTCDFSMPQWYAKFPNELDYETKRGQGKPCYPILDINDSDLYGKALSCHNQPLVKGISIWRLDYAADFKPFEAALKLFPVSSGEIAMPDEATLLKNDVAAIGDRYTGQLLREGVIDLSQYGAGKSERIAAYEKGVYHRFDGVTVAMVRETPGAFDIPDDESNASYDALYRRGKVVWY